MPGDRPPAGRPLSDRELLELPHRTPAREAFGDRFFWPLVAVVGLGFFLVPRLLGFPIQFNKFGLLVIGIGLVGWARERWKRSKQ